MVGFKFRVLGFEQNRSAMGDKITVTIIAIPHAVSSSCVEIFSGSQGSVGNKIRASTATRSGA